MTSSTFDRKFARAIVVPVIGLVVVFALVNPGIAASNGATSLVADNAAPSGTSSTMTPTKHRYWRHRGGTHPHYGSRRVRTPQSTASPAGDK
jgi:hypothetical protein